MDTTLVGLIKGAVLLQDGQKAAMAEHYLRHSRGWNRAKSTRFVKTHTGLEPAEWDELVREGDTR